MRIACVQTDVTFADPNENVQRVLRWMDRCEKADLIVFPECMLSGYVFESRESAMASAIPLESPLLTQIAASASRLAQTVSVGTLLAEPSRLSNAALLINARGVIGCYRKTHMPCLGVDRFVDPGIQLHDPVPVPAITPKNQDVTPCRVGQMICYDASFPEPARVLALLGADVITLGTNWPAGTETIAELVPRTRSLENRVYVAAANRVGTENGCRFIGRSRICAPDGECLATSDDDGEAILEAEIDLSLSRRKLLRHEGVEFEVDRFADRRPELYQLISKANDAAAKPTSNAAAP
ncbi:MAG: carbon-nitrogen hydrolase family protein [Planctomycetota bacterium]